MTAEANLSLADALKKFSQLNGKLIAAAGVVVLLGWLVENQVLMRIAPGLVAMNPLTAVCFIVGGVALACFWATQHRPVAFRSRLAQFSAAGLCVVGATKLADDLFGWNLGLDQFLFRQRLESDPSGQSNRMAPNTAFNFLLSGVVLLSITSPGHRHARLAQNLSLIVTLNSLLALLGYVYGTSYLYGLGVFIPMALHTAALFLLLSVGFLTTQTDQGVMRLLVSDTPGGATARRLLPVALVVPAGLGALRLWGENQGLYENEFGVTLMVLAFMAVFTALIWWNAVRLNRADQRRREAEAGLKKAHDELEVRVQERTADLLMLNETLQAQIAERQKAEEHIHEQAEDKRKLEEQFLRSQRMESIGTLAGGIAHDLNNALAPIVMGAQLLEFNGADEAERNKCVQLIKASANRCTEMVKQILSFARGSRGKVGPVQLRPLIDEMVKIATDTFPKSISIRSTAPKDLWPIRGETTELHQVLMNLCVNARDAMPRGGTLTLSAANTSLTAEALRAHAGATPGPHVVVSVVDTGTGIPPEMLPRIFEPFFSTKSPDKGTGLGLSTVAGIAKRHKGFLEVESKPGQGTEFKIYLPAVAEPQVHQASSPAPTLAMGNGELILIVEDEESVRELTKTTLESCGYQVLTAPNGLEAIACFDVHKRQIRLMITDTDMPLLDGMTAIHAIQKIEPHLPIIVVSGTKCDTEQLRRVGMKHLITMSKPYNVEQLLSSVAKALTPGS